MTSVSETVPSLTTSLERELATGVEPWFPGFGPALARIEWDRLRWPYGITPETYGTARVRAGDAEAERDVRSTIVLPASFDRENYLLIETLRPEPAARYVNLGLDLASPEIAGSPSIATRISAALETIASSRSIAASVGSVLRVLHVALPEGREYDVSYSDPEIPFSVFVGIAPEVADDPVADLRLAEGILHESMHLQLTLVENILPLVADETATHYSPWQDTMRPVRGVLHGTYVFAVIRQLMRAVENNHRSVEASQIHARQRIATIDAEIEGTCWAMLKGEGLSVAGRHLIQRCLS